MLCSSGVKITKIPKLGMCNNGTEPVGVVGEASADETHADFERQRRLEPSPPLLSPPLPTSPRDFVSPTSPRSPVITSPTRNTQRSGKEEEKASTITTSSNLRYNNSKGNSGLSKQPNKKLAHTLTPPWIEKEESVSRVMRVASLPLAVSTNIQHSDDSISIYSGTSPEASRAPFGGTSTTRDSTCYIVREKVVVPSKKGSTANVTYRNVVFAINLTGISILNPFTETMICQYPYKEIKLWKTYNNAFYFLWCPPTARDGVPLLFETRQGDEILKVIGENVEKVLAMRKQGVSV